MESSSSSSSSSKRAKAPGNISQIAHCLVDGCNADLSLCRDYHRRHKVCEAHSKTAKVTIGGRDQRFCQQCSRFHSLVEFDEGKRSCRKRLDGHNRRRRKPQPDSMARTSPQLVFSTQPATTLLSFSSPQILPSSVVGSTWAGLVKPENDMVMFNNSQQLGYNRVNQLQFLQGSDRATVQSEPPAICQPFPDHHGLDQVVANGSDRALSLLSSGPTLACQSMVHNMQFSGLGPFQEEMKPVISSTGPHSESASTTLHFPEMFHNGPEGSSASGTSPHQTLTFMWE